MPSKRLRNYFQDYASYHQTPGNRLTHYFGIPFIVISLLGLLSLITFGLDISANSEYFRIDGGVVLIALAFPIYFFIDWKITPPFILLICGFYFLGRALPTPINWTLFIGGWILQGLGHAKYEKKSPAFFKNFTHLLIGPLWIFSKLIGYK